MAYALLGRLSFTFRGRFRNVAVEHAGWRGCLVVQLLLMGRRSRELRERRQARELEQSRMQRADERLRSGAAERSCLVCRKGDGGFDAVEHVFPESIGNKTYVLPRGVVCDRCNHGELSTLDQTLVGFMPVALRLTMLGVPSKAGKLRVLSLQGETYEHVPGAGGEDPTLVVRSKTKGRHTIHETARHPDGRVEFQMSGSGGRRLTPGYGSELARALLKSALECAWIDHGKATLEERFDHVRDAILGEPRDGFFAVAKTSSKPNSTEVTLSYDIPREENGWRVSVWLEIYGVLMHADSRLAAPPPEICEEDWNILRFTARELVRKRPQVPTPNPGPSASSMLAT